MRENNFVAAAQLMTKLQNDFQTPFARVRVLDVLAPVCLARICSISEFIDSKRYDEAIDAAKQFLLAIPGHIEVSYLLELAQAKSTAGPAGLYLEP